MAERVVNAYKRLFEVRVLHHYWLDEGSQVFDSLDEDIRYDRLLRYDVRQFLSIEPTKTTEQLLSGLQCVFKQTALGFVVAIPAGIEIDNNPTFEFVITVHSAVFFNYTALTFRPQKIYELSSPSDNTIRRYKENVFVFSNTTGSSRILYNPPHQPPTTTVPNPSKRTREIMFLSRLIPTPNPSANYQVESLIQASDSKLWQALADQSGNNLTPPYWKEFAEIDHQPIYIHQDDIPILTLPLGMTGPPYRGLELKPDIPDNVFALIQIEKLTNSNPMGLMNGTTYRSPVYEIRFKNRSTLWKYYDKKTKVFKSEESSSLPMTFFGNAGSKEKPSEGIIKFRKIIENPNDANYATAPISLISEIFV